MELIEVQLIVDSLEDKEQKKDRVKGDKWFVTQERLQVLLGKNKYNKTFVEVTGKITKTEPETKDIKKDKKKKKSE